MNKFINILLFLISMPTMVLAIVVGYDLPLEFIKTSGSQLWYKSEIFLVIGIIYFIIIVRRSSRRWMGSKMVSQVAKFKWNVSMGEGRLKQVFLYQWLEAFVMVIGGFALYSVTNAAIVPACALAFGALDNLVFLFVGKSKHIYRIGLTSKALVVADRDVKVLYLSGLRKVTIHQQTVFFEYIKDLQLAFPLNCIPKENQKEFKEQLEASVDRDKVFFDEKMKSL
jgi:hypothetical protein